MLLGETIALAVALMWTATALFAEVGSKRMGSLPFNAIRMSMSLVMLMLTLWLTTGAPYPRYADAATWGWMLASGLVGYVLGDYCLMQGYIIIGSRFGQLFMTLSAPSAALTARLLLAERMTQLAIAGMCITIVGIAISVLSKSDDTTHHSHLTLRLPLGGVLFACGAGVGQGVGLVLSKVGMQHYEAALLAHGIDSSTAISDALLPLPTSITLPFAATAIRGIMGLAGFLLMTRLLVPQPCQALSHALHDRRAMWCAFGSMMLGPFIGVSLSLMATLYTSAGVAQTIFALVPILIIAPSALLFHQRVRAIEVVGAVISVIGASLFFL